MAMNFFHRKSINLFLLASTLCGFTQSCKSTKKTVFITTAADKYKSELDAMNLHKQKIYGFKRTLTEESAMQDARLTMKIMRENAPKVRLNEYFNAIAYSDNLASANNSITKALAMFTSSEVAVLMVVSEEQGKKRFARPTTIRAYFNHLKDLKENLDDIKNLKIDRFGKITEVELKKGTIKSIDQKSIFPN
jgi:hypothetical protein